MKNNNYLFNGYWGPKEPLEVNEDITRYTCNPCRFSEITNMICTKCGHDWATSVLIVIDKNKDEE